MFPVKEKVLLCGRINSSVMKEERHRRNTQPAIPIESFREAPNRTIRSSLHRFRLRMPAR